MSYFILASALVNYLYFFTLMLLCQLLAYLYLFTLMLLCHLLAFEEY